MRQTEPCEEYEAPCGAYMTFDQRQLHNARVRAVNAARTERHLAMISLGVPISREEMTGGYQVWVKAGKHYTKEQLRQASTGCGWINGRTAAPIRGEA